MLLIVDYIILFLTFQSSMINMSGKCEVGEVMACLSSFLDSHPSPDTDVVGGK